jgi:putative phosphoesterase
VRIAVISDVHANLPALRAVLADINAAAPDAVVSCGDLAAGPLPHPTIDLLRGLDIPVYCVRGNADRAMIETFDGTADPAGILTAWANIQLTRDERDYLATFAATLTLEVDDLGPVLFCHATPRSDDEVILGTSSQHHLDAALAGVREPTVVCGHTHMQFDRQAGRYRLVNAGSVGMPYGQPGAYWALLGPGVSLRRTSYDLQAAASEIRRTSRWPEAESFAAQNVLQPPSADDALAYFQQLENCTAT